MQQQRCTICGDAIADGAKVWRLGDDIEHERCAELLNAPMSLEEKITELRALAKGLQAALFEVVLLGKRLVNARRKWPERSRHVRDLCESQAMRTAQQLRALLARIDRTRATARSRHRPGWR